MIWHRSACVALATFPLLAGCGEPPTTVRAPTSTARTLNVPNAFPTRDDLAKIAAAPSHALQEREVVGVPDWHVDPSEPLDASVAETQLAQILPDVQFDEKLRCIAREMGRVRLEHGGDPDERTQRFIVGACGFTGIFVGAAVGLAEAPLKTSDAQVLGLWNKSVALPASFKNASLGSWLSRKGNKAVLVSVAGKPESSLTISPVDSEGLVRVSGTAASEVEHVLALVNRGSDRVAPCEADSSVVLPRFSFGCTLAGEDRWAWVEVVTRMKGRLMVRSAGLALVRRDDKARIELARSERTATPGAANDVVGSALAGINRARSSIGLSPAALAKEQSSANERLAARFFQAELGHDADTSDRIALGLLAGWDVAGGTIRRGNFFDALLTNTSSTASWMDYALDVPMGRYTLLDPTTRQIAIGAAAPSEVNGVGLLVTTYSMFESADASAAGARLFERIDRARVAKGLPRAKPLGALPHMQEQAKLVASYERDPLAALDYGLAGESQRLRASLRGYVLLANDLDTMPLASELLQSDALGIEVVEYKPPGSPWGAYLVYVALAGETNATALTAERRRCRSMKRCSEE